MILPLFQVVNTFYQKDQQREFSVFIYLCHFIVNHIIFTSLILTHRIQVICRISELEESVLRCLTVMHHSNDWTTVMPGRKPEVRDSVRPPTAWRARKLSDTPRPRPPPPCDWSTVAPRRGRSATDRRAPSLLSARMRQRNLSPLSKHGGYSHCADN